MQTASRANVRRGEKYKMQNKTKQKKHTRTQKEQKHTHVTNNLSTLSQLCSLPLNIHLSVVKRRKQYKQTPLKYPKYDVCRVTPPYGLRLRRRVGFHLIPRVKNLLNIYINILHISRFPTRDSMSAWTFCCSLKDRI